MAEQALVVRSQMIALESFRLLLPNTAIAEVIAYTKPELEDGKPDWYLGHVAWRGYSIPVVSFELMINQAASKPNRRSRIIILNSITGDPERPFYGMLSTGIPRLMSVEATNIEDAPIIGDTDTLMLRQVMVDKHAAVIPDQYELEARLKSNKLATTSQE